ncbi:MAG: hypothetical protein ACOX2F_05105 [bacterium]
MVRLIFSMIFMVLPLLITTSCGGETEEPVVEESDAPAMTLRIISDDCAKETINSSSLNKLGSLAIVIKDKFGELVFRKSFLGKDIESGMKVTGIPDVDNATVILSGFGADANVVQWVGKISGIPFKKGNKTTIDAVLYPTADNQIFKKEIGRPCFPNPLTVPRFGHTATLLPDGRILVAGGFSMCSATKCTANKSVEIIDVESGAVETLADMLEERAMHEAVLLSDGSVLIFGGVRALDIGIKELADFASLPYSFSVQATSVEKYMPLYPKLNMRNNSVGILSENTTVNANLQYGATGMPFLSMQSYYVTTLSENMKTVYLAGGINLSGEPSDKVFAFDIFDTENGLSLSPVREIAPVEKDFMLMPVLGFFGEALFSTGGRAKEPASVASFYGKEDSSNWEGDGPNLFFTKGVMVGADLYTFGGLESKGENSLSNNLRGHKWSIGEKTSSAMTNNLMTYGSALFFSDVVYHESREHFIIVGGAGGDSNNSSQGNSLYQVVDKNTFAGLKAPFSYVTQYRRILPKAVIVPEGAVEEEMIFITGGTTALNSTGVSVGVIEINNLK